METPTRNYLDNTADVLTGRPVVLVSAFDSNNNYNSSSHGNWTLRLRDISPTRHFAYHMDTSPTGHFAYWTVRLRDSSPTRHFAYDMDISPTRPFAANQTTRQA